MSGSGKSNSTKWMWRGWAIGLLLMLMSLIVACLPEGDAGNSVLDLNEEAFLIQTRRAQEATQTANAPTATSVLPTLRPSPLGPTVPPNTPTPMVDRSGYIETTVRSGPWKTSEFIKPDGTRGSFADYESGGVIVVQTFSSECPICLEQTQQLTRAISNQRTTGLENLKVILVSIDPLDTAETITNFQAQNELPRDWVIGLATQTMLRDLRQAFGDSFISPNTGGLFYIDPSGFGQISEIGTVSTFTIETAIVNLISNFATEPAPEG